MTVLRDLLAAIAGYATMAVAVFAGTGIAWAALGPEGAFREGTTEAATGWSLAMCAFGLLASIAGGAIAALAGSRSSGRRPVVILAGLVLALGLAAAVLQLRGAPSPPPGAERTAELTFFEAGAVARSPVWYNFAIPLIGAIGAILGGNVVRFARR